MRKILIVDAIVLLAYAIVSLPQITGVSVHEWLGLGVLVLLLAHVVQHVDWAVDAARSLRDDVAVARHGRLALDVLLMMALAACVVSGLMVSGAVLPAFGLYVGGYYFWNPLHAASAKVLFALLLVHMAANAVLAVRLWRQGGQGDRDGRGECSGRDVASIEKEGSCGK
ncbi:MULTISPECIES: DUF4405 domain-containing protein [unclassified Adlercreutzia]|uniref:DUF4405 domain-containing protein n=1 Tax=unclassified Adlercreutzia TaxID=2636013 RepID=UPI0013ED85CE|nr:MULTISPECIES: DUF4405 domain-containing protein [unclassified Adlercreutzia]